MDNRCAIKVENATVRFNRSSQSIDNLKEYVVKLLKRQLMFQEFIALDNISLEVKPGEAWGILGRNGSGKSTLLKLICGIIEPYKGKVQTIGSIAPLIELGAGFDGRLKGIAFHVSPSNVAVNFAYSLAAGLLSGCRNIVRVPTKDFPQVDLIVQEINGLLSGDFTDLANRICLVRYPADCGATDYFSAICDERIIWGGDKTVASVRRSPMKARAGEITFADRTSAVLINAEGYLATDCVNEIARRFWNDTFLTDQNACTSPVIVVWTGNEIDRAKELFWNSFEKLVAAEYRLSGAQAVGKLHAAYRAAIAFEGVRIQRSAGNLITRVHIDRIPYGLSSYKYNSGFFFETEVDSLDQIVPLCGEELQTLTYLGFDPCEIARWLKKNAPAGIDRVVPMGSSMDFSLIWDGYDLISEMSRIKTVH